MKNHINILIKQVKLVCTTIRSSLNSYGFSQCQVDYMLINILKNVKNTSENKHAKHDIESFNRQLLMLIKQNFKDIVSWLQNGLMNLDCYLYVIEEYQNGMEDINVQFLELNSQQNVQQNQFQIKMSTQSIQSQIFGGIDKNQSQQGSTEMDSIACKSQEHKLKDSLKNIIHKTKLLRAMMERQFMANTMEEVQIGLDMSGIHRRYSGFSAFRDNFYY